MSDTQRARQTARFSTAVAAANAREMAAQGVLVSTFAAGQAKFGNRPDMPARMQAAINNFGGPLSASSAPTAAPAQQKPAQVAALRPQKRQWAGLPTSPSFN